MKMIKEVNLKHDVFKNYDEQENMIEIFRFEDPEGFMVIRRTKDNFTIRLSADKEIQALDEIENVLMPYLEGKVFMIIDVNQEKLVEYLENKGVKLWFGYYDMSLESYDKEMILGELIDYDGELDIYRHILGKAFEPMRSLHGFEPYDWYEANPEGAKEEFEEASSKHNFYGYRIDGDIVGVGIAIDNMIDLIGIRPDLQKKGYGRELLRGVVADMFRKGIDKIEIGVVESNQHVYKLYSDEGFKTDCHKRMYKNY